ncbi:G-protein coupled receptor 84-like [Rhinoraja longicauda]
MDEVDNTNHTWTCVASTMAYRRFGAALGSVVSAAGIAGNGLTLVAFIAQPRLRTPFNLLLLNLSAADLIFCGAVLPLSVHTYLGGRWAWGEGACRAQALGAFTLNLISILGMGLVAASRYALVARPAAFQALSAKPVLVFSLAVGLPWVAAVTCVAPFWSVMEFVPDVCTCTFHRAHGRPYTTILHGLTFGLGLATIAVFYFLIHRRLKRVSRALTLHRNRSGPRGKEGNFRRVTAMCLTMFLAYLVCYLPFCILHLLDKVAPAHPVAQTSVGNLTWLSSCLNPLLYAGMNPQFRRAYKDIFCGGAVWSEGEGARTSQGGRREERSALGLDGVSRDEAAQGEGQSGLRD